jgi:hypothetical protein
MTWNYRVIKETTDFEDTYAIHEVYYRDGKPELWSRFPAGAIGGDTLDDLSACLGRMAQALEKPVLEEDGLSGKLREVDGDA